MPGQHNVAAAPAPADIPLGLYVHLPWCIRKCPYCDFNSHELGETGAPFERYVDALLDDLRLELDSAGGRALSTIFLGGGTPSLFPGAAISRLLDGIRQLTEWVEDIEISMEANPGAADTARFAAYRQAGVNRLSIGVQSFRDDPLKTLGRVHDAAAARAAVGAVRAAGFDNFNIDLMHGLPGDDRDDGLFDLHTAIALEPTHISWYQLTIEEGTAYALKPPVLPSHDAIATQFERGQALLTAHGYERYEVSAYARPGRRARHNLNYWEFADYIGIGAGAHGKLTTPDGVFRTTKRRSPTAYLKAAGRPACASRNGPLDPASLRTEFAINALRLRYGYSERLFESRTGLDSSEQAAPLRQAMERGWVTRDRDRVCPTALGYRFLNELQILFLD